MTDAAVALFRDHGHPPGEVSIAAILAAWFTPDSALTDDDMAIGRAIRDRLGIKPGLNPEDPALGFARMRLHWRVMRATMARAEGWPKEVEDDGTQGD